MKQTYNHIVLLIAVVMLVTGCKKYLTVEPEASYTEDQVFSNEKAAQQALNGIYNNLADNTLYGANLSSTTIELMGQRYNVQYNGGNNFLLFQQYSYSQSSVQSVFDALWQKAYTTILSANSFIPKMDKMAQSGTLSKEHAQQMKGEAIAIRAFLHFDILRLFGPVYATSPGNVAVPYYKIADGNAEPILPASQVLDSVLADLSQAETLLANDPIITGGVKAATDFYSSYRNQRMNYYAVKGLMARAYLWGGNNTAAFDSAQAVLSQGEKWFPWTSASAIGNPSDPNRIFSPEMLFGVYNQTMYTDYLSYFGPALTPQAVLTAQPTRLDRIFEANQNDYRYPDTWTNSTNGYRTFDKFKDVATPSTPWRFIQPLLRKSEMYYIMAETGTDPTQAFAALDTVRNYRNLTPLAPSAILSSEIMKEYQKEFWGEGQLFFYYKRTNQSSIPSGVSYYSNVVPVYVVPLPLSETTPR